MGQERAMRPAGRSIHCPRWAHSLERKAQWAENPGILGRTPPTGLLVQTRPRANIPQNNANKLSHGCEELRREVGTQRLQLWLQRKVHQQLPVCSSFPTRSSMPSLGVIKVGPLMAWLSCSLNLAHQLVQVKWMSNAL